MLQEIEHDTVSGRLAEIAEIAADLFSVTAGEVEAARSFVDDVEADSLLVIELLSHLEKRYGITIPEGELFRLVDLRSTYDVVAEHAGW